MTTTNALWVDGISVHDARRNFAALVAKTTSDPLDVRQGIFYTGWGTSIIQPTATIFPSMTVSVERFHYVARKATADGCYLGCHRSVDTLDVAAAPASGSRIDVVYIMQRDANAPTSPDGSTTGELGIVTGLSGATPSKPAIPTGALEVGTVTVGAGATKTTDAQVTIAVTAPYTAPQGAPVPVRNVAERNALTPYVGRQVIRLDLGGLLQTYNGSGWRGDMTQTGTGNVGQVAASSGGAAVDVTFPTPFPGAPQAVVVAPGSGRLTYTVSNISATGCTVLFDNWSTGVASANTFRWNATYAAT